jgi:hypothetical protein
MQSTLYYKLQCHHLRRRRHRHYCQQNIYRKSRRAHFNLIPLFKYVEMLREEERKERIQALARYLQRRDKRVPRPALLMPWESSFEKILYSGNEQSLITVTGFDFYSFNLLHDMFAPVFNTHSPYSTDGNIKLLNMRETRGRPRLCTSEACLAMNLAYFRSKGEFYWFCTFFGITYSAYCLWLRFGRRIILHILYDHPNAKVQMPTPDKVADYVAHVVQKYPLLDDVYCFADGLKIPINPPEDPAERLNFYNGWIHGYYVSNVFIFVPDGSIVGVTLNCPGSYHDAEVCTLGGLYDKLEETYMLCNGKCVMDSAFSSRGKPYVIKSAQNRRNQRNNNNRNLNLDYERNKQATSLRQSAEWGMGALQGTFQRLRVSMKYEEFQERRFILETTVLLYNWRVNTVGLNQIRSVFMPHLDTDWVEMMYGVITPDDPIIIPGHQNQN